MSKKRFNIFVPNRWYCTTGNTNTYHPSIQLPPFLPSLLHYLERRAEVTGEVSLSSLLFRDEGALLIRQGKAKHLELTCI